MFFSRGEVLAIEFVGMAIFSALLALWAYRKRRTLVSEEERVTLMMVLCALKRETGRIFLRGDPAPTILGVSFLVIAIGLKFLATDDTLGSSRSYAYLNRTVFNETTWGAGLVLLGAAKLGLLGYNSIPSEHPYRLSYFLGAGLNTLIALVWFNFAAGIAVLNGSSFGYLTYGMLSLLSLWASSRRLRQGSGGS